MSMASKVGGLVANILAWSVKKNNKHRVKETSKTLQWVKSSAWKTSLGGVQSLSETKSFDIREDVSKLAIWE